MVWKIDYFFIQFDFKRGEVDKIIFIKSNKHYITITQIYVDDIVFEYTSVHLLDEFVTSMSTTFEMSMVGELYFFLGLQIMQLSNGKIQTHENSNEFKLETV